jgi:hypothetical protein
MLRPGDTTALRALTLPPIFEDAIGSTVASGQFAAAPRRPVTVSGAAHEAWWAIDAASGNTIGRVDDGGGQEMLETAVVIANDVNKIKEMMHYAFQLHECGWAYASSSLENSAAVKKFHLCVTEELCKFLAEFTQEAIFGLFAEEYESAKADFELGELMTSDLQGDFLDWGELSNVACST